MIFFSFSLAGSEPSRLFESRKGENVYGEYDCVVLNLTKWVKWLIFSNNLSLNFTSG